MFSACSGASSLTFWLFNGLLAASWKQDEAHEPECSGKCKVSSVKCGVWRVECKVRSVNCKVWSVEVWIG